MKNISKRLGWLKNKIKDLHVLKIDNYLKRNLENYKLYKI